MQDCWARIRGQDIDVASGSYQTTQSQSKSVPTVIRNLIIAQDFNPKNFVKTMDYIYYGSLLILFLVIVRSWLWQPHKSEFYAWLLGVQFTTSISASFSDTNYDRLLLISLSIRRTFACARYCPRVQRPEHQHIPADLGCERSGRAADPHCRVRRFTVS